MTRLVADASLLIELQHGDLHEAALANGRVILVSNLLYANELEMDNGPYLRELGLEVTPLSQEELLRVQMLKHDYPGLSASDHSILVCASRRNHSLITEQPILQNAASDKGIEFHGLLWLMDILRGSPNSDVRALCEGLRRIASHRRSRLSQEGVRKRLRDWGDG